MQKKNREIKLGILFKELFNQYWYDESYKHCTFEVNPLGQGQITGLLKQEDVYRAISRGHYLPEYLGEMKSILLGTFGMSIEVESSGNIFLYKEPVFNSYIERNMKQGQSPESLKPRFHELISRIERAIKEDFFSMSESYQEKLDELIAADKKETEELLNGKEVFLVDGTYFPG